MWGFLPLSNNNIRPDILQIINLESIIIFDNCQCELSKLTRVMRLKQGYTMFDNTRSIRYNSRDLRGRRRKKMLQEARTWRELLKVIAGAPQDREELSARSGIEGRTLERWMTGRTRKPPDYLLRQLLDAIPQHREQMLRLLQREFEEFEAPLLPIDETLKEVPIAFVLRVLEANATVADPLHFWAIVNMLLQQLAAQLDPDATGLSLYVAVCMPPRPDGLVRSLCIRAAHETAPRQQTDQQPLGEFLGAESLAGYVASSCSAEVAQDIQQERYLFPIRREPHEASAAAYPIQRKGRVAGSLVATSTRPYFFTPARLSLLQHYSYLLVLAFEREAFHDLAQVRLGQVPRLEEQRPLLAEFPSHVLSLQQERRISQEEAEEVTRQMIEVQLLSPGTQGREGE
jgi:hypothetical protein